MMKAATLSLALIALLAAASAAPAQTPPQETAVNEAVYRQANRIALRQKLAGTVSTFDSGQNAQNAQSEIATKSQDVLKNLQSTGMTGTGS